MSTRSLNSKIGVTINFILSRIIDVMYLILFDFYVVCLSQLNHIIWNLQSQSHADRTLIFLLPVRGRECTCIALRQTLAHFATRPLKSKIDVMLIFDFMFIFRSVIWFYGHLLIDLDVLFGTPFTVPRWRGHLSGTSGSPSPAAVTDNTALSEVFEWADVRLPFRSIFTFILDPLGFKVRRTFPDGW